MVDTARTTSDEPQKEKGSMAGTVVLSTAGR
jgi:hypothetical protein